MAERTPQATNDLASTHWSSASQVSGVPRSQAGGRAEKQEPGVKQHWQPGGGQSCWGLSEAGTWQNVCSPADQANMSRPGQQLHVEEEAASTLLGRDWASLCLRVQVARWTTGKAPKEGSAADGAMRTRACLRLQARATVAAQRAHIFPLVPSYGTACGQTELGTHYLMVKKGVLTELRSPSLGS